MCYDSISKEVLIMIRASDYDTSERVRVVHCITDETFVAPADLPFAVEEGYLMPALDALKRFQEQMKGEGVKAGFLNDEDVAEWITESRRREEIS